MWVSLIEKAYLKLQGGYDFDGSNSARDLYILTGWLPESLSFSKDFDPAKTWERIYKGTQHNKVLITLRTGTIPDEDAIGLVGTHAYAVLEVFKTSQGHKMLLIKNPWGHYSWKGKYSFGDSNWTP